MKFSEYVYERPDINKMISDIKEILKEIDASTDVEVLKSLINKVNSIMGDFDTMATLCSVRNSINTTDEFYEEEQNFFDANSPLFSSVKVEFCKSLVNNKLRKELENYYGSHWFKLMELSLKTFDDRIVEDSIKENQLVSKYNKLMASAKIEFDGKINNLSQMGKYATNVNRDIRRSAALKVQEFLAQNENEITTIYDDLVHVRTTMAKKMGYESYTTFGYDRLNRTDYDSKMVSGYRKQVLDELVPIVKDIYAKQANRLGIDNPKFYDLSLEFLDGNPTPKGTPQELVQKAKIMYNEMSRETGEYFDFMTSHELLDLESKPGKEGGGYCTYIINHKSPFIFANFNGTQHDVEVLTHEAGHGFQVYQASKYINNADLIWPTYEACEIHSMSMEFFAYPWLESFFKEDIKKFKYSHMSGTLTFIPYGVAVDEFQHFVYDNPDCGITARNEKWREIEKKYLPWRDFGELEVFNHGGYWYRQSHIFQTPFYYIDYTLAQVCAIDFYLSSLDNKEETWNRYVNLCKLGGSKSFLELLASVGIKNPFKEGTIASIAARLKPVIEKNSI